MELDDWRSRIDHLNRDLVQILNERAACALRIGELKQRVGRPIRDPDRERRVLEDVSSVNKGPLSDEALHRIFDAIMREHRLLEGERESTEEKDRA
jgi:chorismate mutase